MQLPEHRTIILQSLIPLQSGTISLFDGLLIPNILRQLFEPMQRSASLTSAFKRMQFFAKILIIEQSDCGIHSDILY
jgi:hypothetical protein